MATPLSSVLASVTGQGLTCATGWGPLSLTALKTQTPALIRPVLSNGHLVICAAVCRGWLSDVPDCVVGMNKLTPDYPLDLEHVRSQIAARDGALV